MKYAFCANAETRGRKTIDQVWCVCTCNQRYCRWKIHASVKETIAMVHLHHQLVLVLRAWLFSRELRWKAVGKVAFMLLSRVLPSLKEIDVWSGDYVIGLTLCDVFILASLLVLNVSLDYQSWPEYCRRFAQKQVKIVSIISSIRTVFVTSLVLQAQRLVSHLWRITLST